MPEFPATSEQNRPDSHATPEGFSVTGSGFDSTDGDFVVWDTMREISGFTFAVSEYEQSSIEWNGIPDGLG